MDELLNTTLTIIPGQPGGYNSDGKWIYSLDLLLGLYLGTGIPENAYEITCSVQPFRTNGMARLNFPEGTTQEDVLVAYTQTDVSCGDLNSEPDSTVINGKPYYAFKKMDWSMVGLDIAHYVIYFIRIHNDGWPE